MVYIVSAHLNCRREPRDFKEIYYDCEIDYATGIDMHRVIKNRLSREHLDRTNFDRELNSDLRRFDRILHKELSQVTDSRIITGEVEFEAKLGHFGLIYDLIGKGYDMEKLLYSNNWPTAVLSGFLFEPSTKGFDYMIINAIQLIRLGANINRIKLDQKPHWNGDDRNPHVEQLYKFLIEKFGLHPDLLIDEKRGYTMLHYCLVSDNISLLPMLLYYNSDPTWATEDGLDSLDLAIKNLRELPCQILIDTGKFDSIQRIYDTNMAISVMTFIKEKSDICVIKNRKILSLNESIRTNIEAHIPFWNNTGFLTKLSLIARKGLNLFEGTKEIIARTYLKLSDDMPKKQKLQQAIVISERILGFKGNIMLVKALTMFGKYLDENHDDHDHNHGERTFQGLDVWIFTLEYILAQKLTEFYNETSPRTGYIDILMSSIVNLLNKLIGVDKKMPKLNDYLEHFIQLALKLASNYNHESIQKPSSNYKLWIRLLYTLFDSNTTIDYKQSIIHQFVSIGVFNGYKQMGSFMSRLIRCSIHDCVHNPNDLDLDHSQTSETMRLLLRALLADGFKVYSNLDRTQCECQLEFHDIDLNDCWFLIYQDDDFFRKDYLVGLIKSVGIYVPEVIPHIANGKRKILICRTLHVDRFKNLKLSCLAANAINDYSLKFNWCNIAPDYRDIIGSHLNTMPFTESFSCNYT